MPRIYKYCGDASYMNIMVPESIQALTRDVDIRRSRARATIMRRAYQTKITLPEPMFVDRR
jgi:hypothetical protein